MTCVADIPTAEWVSLGVVFYFFSFLLFYKIELVTEDLKALHILSCWHSKEPRLKHLLINDNIKRTLHTTMAKNRVENPFSRIKLLLLAHYFSEKQLAWKSPSSSWRLPRSTRRMEIWIFPSFHIYVATSTGKFFKKRNLTIPRQRNCSTETWDCKPGILKQCTFVFLANLKLLFWQIPAVRTSTHLIHEDNPTTLIDHSKLHCNSLLHKAK